MQSKTAQERKIRHNLRRLVNPTGKALSALSPAFKKTIRNLDKVDKQVRKEAEDLNYYIGMAKSFYRRKDYLTCATYLAKFHEKAKTIHHKLNAFNQSITGPQRKFLLKNFKSNDKKHLFNYDPSKKIEEEKYSVDDGLLATAGIGSAIKDWWRVPSKFTDLKESLFDRKSQAMRAMEKNFSVPFFKQLKDDTKEMMGTTQVFYKELLENFHNMGFAWGARNVGAYVSEIQAINTNYEAYNKPYLEYHSQNIAPMIEEQKRIDAEEQKEKEQNDAKAADALALLEQEKAKAAPLSVHQDPFKDAPKSSAPQPSGESRAPAPPSSYPEYSANNGWVESKPTSGVKPTDPSPGVTDKPKSTNRFPFYTAPAHHAPASVPASVPYVENPKSLNVPYVKGPFVKSPDTQRGLGGPNSEPFSFTQRPWQNHSTSEFHEEFLSRIEKLSDDQDIIREILSYSEEVENYSEEQSLKLLAIAEGLIEKHAGPKNKKDDPAKTPKVKEAPPKVVKLEAPVPSEPFPASDPPTEVVPPSPFTQRSGPMVDAPGTRRIPTSMQAEPAKTKLDLVDKLHHEKFEPVNHGIPFGTVKKRWFDIPFLAKKKEHDIRVSPNTADVLVKGIVAALRTYFLPYNEIENFPSKFVQAIKHSVTEGQIESNMQCSSNRDCQLQVFSGFLLEDIDQNPAFADLAISFTATCRLTDMGGDIIIGKITNIKLQNVSK